jgi:hypothetical protein
MQRDTRYADAKVIETQIAEGRARNAQAHRLAMLDAAWRASLTRVATSHICVGTIPGAWASCAMAEVKQNENPRGSFCPRNSPVLPLQSLS